MKPHKHLLFVATTTFTLGLLTQAAHAAQGYTVRLTMANEQHAPFTLEEISTSHTRYNPDKSTGYSAQIGYAETGEYNYLHGESACKGNTLFKVVDRSGLELGQCKVSWEARAGDDSSDNKGACAELVWNNAQCTGTMSGIQFNTRSKGKHHHDFDIK